MASIAVLPVLIGLAVDYAIQFQARFDEEQRRRRPGAARPPSRRSRPPRGRRSHDRHGRRWPRRWASWCCCCSPVPMVRGFGVLLVLGIGLALACALVRRLRGAGALRQAARPLPRSRARGGWPRIGTAPASCEAGTRAAGRPLPGVRSGGAGAPAPGAGDRAGGRGGSGWRSTPRARWCPTCASWCRATSRRCEDVNELQEATGVSGEIDVTVRADDITDPRCCLDDPLPARRAARARLPRRASAAARPSDPPELCPALSLPDLFGHRRRRSAAGCAALLDSVPPYFSQGVVTRDRKTANLAFGIRLMPLDAPEGGGGRHQAAARPARRRGGRRGRPAGARGRGERRAVLAAGAGR